MKHHIEWLKDNLEIHVQMTIGEAMSITLCLVAIAGIIVICIAHII
jgi:hypothetical protein